VTYRIVENHGGRITVSSQPGGGAEFVVALPVKTVREKA
jgi:signal transduction histidine kinase